MKPCASPRIKPAKVRAVRPDPGGLAAALDEANTFRPGHVPAEAVLLTAWVSLPGDNAQRGHWKKQITWKEALKGDFTACLELQGHPGLIREPGVHIAMHVARKGDDNNLLARAKYVIDLLQTYKQTVTGKRVQGLLDLIENDDALNSENRGITEQLIPAQSSVEVFWKKTALEFSTYPFGGGSFLP